MKRAVKVLSVLCILSVLFIVSAAPALAFEGRGGDTIVVGSGETLDDDLYAAGGDIIIDGTVNGDVFAAGRSLTINGEVNGGVSFAGQTAMINGEVTRGVRFAGQSITVNGQIGRDLVAAGGQLNIGRDAEIGDDLVMGMGTAQINGRIGGDIRAGAGDVTIANGVGGNVEMEVEQLTITSSASIAGNVNYLSQNEANIESGAQISGEVTRRIPERDDVPAAPGILAGLAGAVLWKVLSFLMTFIVGLVVILLASRRLAAMAGSIQSHPWLSLGWGAILLFGVPIAAVIVMITVIGLPLGLIALVLYAIAIYLSQIPVALLIGKLIIRPRGEMDSKGLMIGAFALGLVILSLLTLIPFVGWFIGLLVVLFGLGSMVTSTARVSVERL
jgi:hypothetical protein